MLRDIQIIWGKIKVIHICFANRDQKLFKENQVVTKLSQLKG